MSWSARPQLSRELGNSYPVSSAPAIWRDSPRNPDPIGDWIGSGLELSCSAHFGASCPHRWPTLPKNRKAEVNLKACVSQIVKFATKL